MAFNIYVFRQSVSGAISSIIYYSIAILNFVVKAHHLHAIQRYSFHYPMGFNKSLVNYTRQLNNFPPTPQEQSDSSIEY